MHFAASNVNVRSACDAYFDGEGDYVFSQIKCTFIIIIIIVIIVIIYDVTLLTNR